MKKFFINTEINISVKTNNEKIIPYSITLTNQKFTVFLTD